MPRGYHAIHHDVEAKAALAGLDSIEDHVLVALTLGHSVLRTHSPNEGKIVFFFLDGASAHGW